VTPLDELANSLPPVPAEQQFPRRELHRARLLAVISSEPAHRRPWRLAAPRLPGRWPVAKGWLVPISAAVAVIAVAAAALTLSLTAFGRPASHQAPQAGRSAPPGQAPAGPLSRAEHWQLASAGLRAVVVRTNSGSVNVVGDSRSGPVAIEARPSYQRVAPVLSRKVTGGVLTVSALCPSRSVRQLCAVTLQLSLPPGIPVTASTNLGSVGINNMTGAVKATDNLGPIALFGLAGPVTATDNLGAIRGYDLRSRHVTMSDQLGAIGVSFASVPDLVQATDQNGSVTIAVPTSTTYRVAAHAQLGLVTISVPQSSSSLHVIMASSQLGSVTVEG
jgi:hypothetical protein